MNTWKSMYPIWLRFALYWPLLTTGLVFLVGADAASPLLLGLAIGAFAVVTLPIAYVLAHVLWAGAGSVRGGGGWYGLGDGGC